MESIASLPLPPSAAPPPAGAAVAGSPPGGFAALVALAGTPPTEFSRPTIATPLAPPVPPALEPGPVAAAPTTPTAVPVQAPVVPPVARPTPVPTPATPGPVQPAPVPVPPAMPIAAAPGALPSPPPDDPTEAGEAVPSAADAPAQPQPDAPADSDAPPASPLEVVAVAPSPPDHAPLPAALEDSATVPPQDGATVQPDRAVAPPPSAMPVSAIAAMAQGAPAMAQGRPAMTGPPAGAARFGQPGTAAGANMAAMDRMGAAAAAPAEAPVEDAEHRAVAAHMPTAPTAAAPMAAEPAPPRPDTPPRSIQDGTAPIETPVPTIAMPPSPAISPTTPANAPAPHATPARQIAPVLVAVAIAGGTARLSVTLDPAELGRVEISVERQGETTEVRVIAERPETLALIQRDQRELDRALTQAGIGSEGRSLSFSLSSDAGAGGFSQGHESNAERLARGMRGPGANSAASPDTQAIASAPPRRLLSLLDLAV